jgi:putative ABC transport system permease protein
VIGVSTVVGIISFVEAMTSDINHKLEKFGANILIVPRTENLTLTYGGLSLGGVSFEMEEIRQEELAQVSAIKNARNIAALGPLVLGVVNVDSHKVLLAGVDFKASAILKPWWQLQGNEPDDNGVILGAEAARISQRGLRTINWYLPGWPPPSRSLTKADGFQWPRWLRCVRTARLRKW